MGRDVETSDVGQIDVSVDIMVAMDAWYAGVERLNIMRVHAAAAQDVDACAVAEYYVEAGQIFRRARGNERSSRRPAPRTYGYRRLLSREGGG